MAGIGAFFTTLAGIFKLWDDVKAFLEMRQSVSDDEWNANGALIIKAMKGAKTDDERRAALRRLADHASDA